MATVMAFGAHPDDIEIGCSGTLMKLKDEGHRVVCCDLVRGELSTRGTLETRQKETALAGEIMGIDCRENLALEDGFVGQSKESKIKVVEVIRKYRPDIVFLQYYEDRHPDHYNASQLIYEASFLSGLVKIDTGQEAHRPSKMIYYMGWFEFKPTFICNISEYFERKKKVIEAYYTQLNSEDKSYPQTRLTGEAHHWYLLSRHSYYGSLIGKKYGEAFYIKDRIEVEDITSLKFQSF